MSERRRVMAAAALSPARRHGFDDHRPTLTRSLDVDVAGSRRDESRAVALWEAIADTAGWAAGMAAGLEDRRAVVLRMRRLVDAIDLLLDELLLATAEERSER